MMEVASQILEAHQRLIESILWTYTPTEAPFLQICNQETPPTV